MEFLWFTILLVTAQLLAEMYGIVILLCCIVGFVLLTSTVLLVLKSMDSPTVAASVFLFVYFFWLTMTMTLFTIMKNNFDMEHQHDSSRHFYVNEHI